MTTSTKALTERRPSLDRARASRWAAVVGVVAGILTLATAEVVSLVVGGRGNPILSTGSLIIDLAPPGVKSLVIALFDTADKAFLFVILGLTVLVLAALVGVLEHRRAHVGVAVLAGIGVLSLIAALTRAGANFLNALPTIAGVVAGAALLRALIERLAEWRDAPARTPGVHYERRTFLRGLIAVGVTSAVVGVIARSVGAASAAVQQARNSIRLPAATTVVEALPADAKLDVAGISPWLTPTSDFYRIDTALQVPSIDPTTWKLRITGMVENEIEIGYQELLGLPLEEHYATLACVSNEVGGTLIGKALWLGYPIRTLLARAKPTAGADMVLSSSSDGFTAGTPLAALQDPDRAAILAVAMNREPLPVEHGFPVRIVVPGLFGYVSATKWVVELKVTTFANDMGYWTPRGWSALGPVKVSSRIDTPRQQVAVGTVAVAGVAWAQHTGISKVEVKIDRGEWVEASLARAVTPDSWVQWSYAWDAVAGSHDITVRATDASGLVQTADVAPPDPDGSTGLHRVTVSVA